MSCSGQEEALISAASQSFGPADLGCAGAAGRAGEHFCSHGVQKGDALLLLVLMGWLGLMETPQKQTQEAQAPSRIALFSCGRVWALELSKSSCLGWDWGRGRGRVVFSSPQELWFLLNGPQ